MNTTDYWGLWDLWEILRENGVEEQTLQVVTDINGYNEETLNDIGYAMFGVRDVRDLV